MSNQYKYKVYDRHTNISPQVMISHEAMTQKAFNDARTISSLPCAIGLSGSCNLIMMPDLKSFIAKRVKSNLVNLKYLRLKLLKCKENNEICNTFDHSFKNIPLDIMRKVSLERYYFILYDGALTLKFQNGA